MTVTLPLLDDDKRMPEVNREDVLDDLRAFINTQPPTTSATCGLFAGAFLDGSALRPDNDANQRLYNRNITAKEIVLDGKIAPPSAAEELLSEMNERSPKNLSR